jgi:putative radical SAM enzyme (TIGR03279 family)
MHKHIITAVSPDSIGASLELEAGDFLLEINGKEIGDVFDYRMAVQTEKLILLIEKSGGELWELDIEKDEDEDLGLAFETPLMDEIRSCYNQCIFCFIDQQPPGQRDSLYIKDDDPRLSFLHGNYITLTNADEGEIKRLADYHLSPLRLSVHTVDPDLRCKMTGNKNAGNLFKALEVFNRAGIEMHFQTVLCKGINDGAKLDETIEGLLKYKPGAASLAVVPAGLTRYREGLTALEGFTPEDARTVIKQVKKWQRKCRGWYGSSFVFAADEWYVFAEWELPGCGEYEDFPQLDNGVGMLALFIEQNRKAAKRAKRVPVDSDTCGFEVKIGLVTGAAAYDFINKLAMEFEAHHPNVKIKVFKIENRFFGESVTVSGLLMGGDVIQQLQGLCDGLAVLFLPQNAFRAGTETMLDGITREGLEKALNVNVCIGNADGGEFYSELMQAVKFAKPPTNKV